MNNTANLIVDLLDSSEFCKADAGDLGEICEIFNKVLTNDYKWTYVYENIEDFLNTEYDHAYGYCSADKVTQVINAADTLLFNLFNDEIGYYSYYAPVIFDSNNQTFDCYVLDDDCGEGPIPYPQDHQGTGLSALREHVKRILIDRLDVYTGSDFDDDDLQELLTDLKEYLY